MQQGIITMNLQCVKLLIVLKALNCSVCPADVVFFCHENNVGILKGHECLLLSDGKKIGFLCYVKLPLVNWYVLFNFFTIQNQRHKGYGRMVLNHVLELLKEAGATKIFIQPGPYEIVEGKQVVLIDATQRELRIAQLISYYETSKFRLIKNSFIEYLLNWIYKILAIPENPHFLMIAE